VDEAGAWSSVSGLGFARVGRVDGWVRGGVSGAVCGGIWRRPSRTWLRPSMRYHRAWVYERWPDFNSSLLRSMAVRLALRLLSDSSLCCKSAYLPRESLTRPPIRNPTSTLSIPSTTIPFALQLPSSKALTSQPATYSPSSPTTATPYTPYPAPPTPDSPRPPPHRPASVPRSPQRRYNSSSPPHSAAY